MDDDIGEFERIEDLKSALKDTRTPVVFSITDPAHCVLGLLEVIDGRFVLTFVDPGRQWQIDRWTGPDKDLIKIQKNQTFRQENKKRFANIFDKLDIDLEYGLWEDEFGDDGYNGLGPLKQDKQTCAITSIIGAIFLVHNRFPKKDRKNQMPYFKEKLLRQMWCGLKTRAAEGRCLNPRMYKTIDTLITAIVYADQDHI